MKFPSTNHNHKHCIDAALQDAEAYCCKEGLRLTELRRRVLELIWTSHKPVGAYALLEQINHRGRKAAPPTVYRSLEFLLEHHLIHRIASQNAFVGCNHPGQAHDAQFFICSLCGETAELDDPNIDNALSKDAQYLGFRIERQVVEISGICAQCAGNGVA